MRGADRRSNHLSNNISAPISQRADQLRTKTELFFAIDTFNSTPSERVHVRLWLSSFSLSLSGARANVCDSPSSTAQLNCFQNIQFDKFYCELCIMLRMRMRCLICMRPSPAYRYGIAGGCTSFYRLQSTPFASRSLFAH